MEFSEKLQILRKQDNLTQEELAEKLYVSRTAVSKWESGRGYPSIDSLKSIAGYFRVTVDELIGTEELVSLAESDLSKQSEKKITKACGIIDCMMALIFILPLFGQQGMTQIDSVNLLALSDTDAWQKILYIIFALLIVANGICTLILNRFDNHQWNKHRILTGMGLLVFAILLFMLSRQPYAGCLCLFLLVAKGLLILKNK